MTDFPVVDEQSFPTQTASGLVVIDFYADWCGPCKMLNPILEEAANEVGDKAKFVKVDVDKSQQLASKYSVTSIPTIVFLKDGAEVDRFVGVRDKDAIIEIINSH